MNAVSELVTNPANKWVQQTGKAGAQFTKKGVLVKCEVEGVVGGLVVH
jgi:hypothetical protein